MKPWLLVYLVALILAVLTAVFCPHLAIRMAASKLYILLIGVPIIWALALGIRK